MVEKKTKKPIIVPKPGDVPRWIHETEACIACNRQAKLVSHKMNIDHPETYVEIYYKCDKCGYDSGWHYGDRYVESYQLYLDEKKKLETTTALTIS